MCASSFVDATSSMHFTLHRNSNKFPFIRITIQTTNTPHSTTTAIHSVKTDIRFYKLHYLILICPKTNIISCGTYNRIYIHVYMSTHSLTFADDVILSKVLENDVLCLVFICVICVIGKYCVALIASTEMPTKQNN